VRSLFCAAIAAANNYSKMCDSAAAATAVASPAKAAESPAKRVSLAGMQCECCSRPIDANNNQHYVTFKRADYEDNLVYVCQSCIVRQPDDEIFKCGRCKQPVEAGSSVFYERIKWDDAPAEQADDNSSYEYDDDSYLKFTHATCLWECSSCHNRYGVAQMHHTRQCADPTDASKHWCSECTVKCLICHQWASLRDHTNIIVSDEYFDQTCVHKTCARIAGALYTAMFKECAESVLSLTTTAFAAAIQSTKQSVADAPAAPAIGAKRGHNGAPASTETISDTGRATDSTIKATLRGRRRHH
jgi:hypothetical protein